MNVVCHAADFQRFHAVLARDAAQVGPEAMLKGGGDERTPFFGGEHTMDQTTDKRMHSGFSISSVPAGLISVPARGPIDEPVGYFLSPCRAAQGNADAPKPPQGTIDNSPAIDRWENHTHKIPSPARGERAAWLLFGGPQSRHSKD